MRSVLAFPYHFIAGPGGRRELYDVAQDAAELRDLGARPENASLVRRLEKTLDSLSITGR
jgi:hypothetical protein